MLRRTTCTALFVASIARLSGSIYADVTEQKPTPEAQVKTLIAALDSDKPSDRESAQWGLEAVSFDDLPLLEQALEAGKLSPEQQTRLESVVAFQKPRVECFQARVKKEAPVARERIDMMVEAYKKNGHANPKWDAAVLAMFDERAKEITSLSVRAAQTAVAESAAQAKKALDAGCDDPDFLAAAGLIVIDGGVQGIDPYELFERARDNFQGDHVSPLAKTIALGRIIRARAGEKMTPPDRAKALNEFTGMIQCFKRFAATPAVNPQIVLDVASNVWETSTALRIDPVWMYKSIGPTLERLAPQDPTSLCIKGNYLIAWAYVARGRGYANTVTEQGWKDFGARIQLASDAFTAAYDADPLCAEAAEMMIEVEMFQDHDRSEMEKWYSRAMAISPHPVSVTTKKRYYLEPKWRGSAEAMVQFGHECVAADQGRSDLTLEPLRVHVELSETTADPDAYLSTAAVYADISAAAKLYLKRNPDEVWARCWIAKLACMNQDWKAADAHFKLLGGEIAGTAFKSKAEASRMAAKAARMVKKED